MASILPQKILTPSTVESALKGAQVPMTVCLMVA